MTTPVIPTATILAFDAIRRKRAEVTHDSCDTSNDSGYGYRRSSFMGDVVSLGSATVILFWVCVATVMCGFALGLYVG